MTTSSSPSPHIIEVTEANFQEEVVQRSMTTPVVIDFWADWCGPCKALTPILEELTARYNGAFILAKLNTEENPRIAQYFQIQSIPNVKAIFQGRLVNEFTGALPIDKIDEWLKTFIDPDSIPETPTDYIQEGHDALEQGDTQAAVEAFNTHLKENPGSPDSSIALARIALQQQDTASVRALLDQINADALTPKHESDIAAIKFMLDAETPERSEEELKDAIKANSLDYQARHDLAMLYASQGELDSALGELLDIVIRDREWEDDKARKTMVQLFEVMGLTSSKTREWQKKLGRAMY